MVNHFNKSNSQKKIVVAMDSFKGSLTSLEAGNAVRDGILERYPDVDVQIFPVADGGEGKTGVYKAKQEEKLAMARKGWRRCGRLQQRK